MIETVSYAGWANCVKLKHGGCELVATTDVGPRILSAGFTGGPNMLYSRDADLGRTGDPDWRLYGGHRLWHAPEARPRTFFPDNAPVAWHAEGDTLVLTQPVEATTGIAKRIAIAPSPDGFTLTHSLTNTNLWEVTLAPWAVTMLAPGGRAIIPQEPYRPHHEAYLPVRALVLWPYTRMGDPRFVWGDSFVQIRQDPALTSYQKVGFSSSLGWAAYAWDEQVFVKRHPVTPDAAHADRGCNLEVFVSGDYLELESLGPLTRLAPGETVFHAESWEFHRLAVGRDEGAVAEALGFLTGRGG